MRILKVTPFYPSQASPYGGSYVHNQVKALRHMDLLVDVLVTMPHANRALAKVSKNWDTYLKTPNAYYYEAVPVKVFRYLALPSNLSLRFSGIQIFNLLRRVLPAQWGLHSPDILHAHFSYPTGFAACQIAQLLGIPSVVTVHGTDIFKYPHLGAAIGLKIRDTLLRADMVLCSSKALHDEVMKLEPRSKALRAYIGIDTRRFSPMSRSVSRSEIPELRTVGDPIALYVGNLIPSKGIKTLLEGFRLSLQSGANCHLVIVGRGQLENEINRFIASNGLRERITVLGPRSNSEMPGIMAASDILLLPSLSEGLGLVAVEALAMQRPVIGTRVGGIPEVVREDTGILVEPNDPEGLAQALLLLLRNPEMMTRMGLAGRDLVLKLFDLNRNTDSLHRLYEDICERRKLEPHASGFGTH